MELSVTQFEDAVKAFEIDPVGDDQQGSAISTRPKAAPEFGLNSRVKAGGRFVEHKHRRIDEQGSCKDQASRLPARQREPRLANDDIDAARGADFVREPHLLKHAPQGGVIEHRST